MGNASKWQGARVWTLLEEWLWCTSPTSDRDFSSGALYALRDLWKTDCVICGYDIVAQFFYPQT
ncbi:hypothetical protein CGBL_0120680 [Corynebacterium glutamicum]|nr:hypothetical protein CGBL_0120680 [Corynebacterium glutamicum]